VSLSIVVGRYVPFAPTTPDTSQPVARMMLFPDEGTGDPVLVPYAPQEVHIQEDAGTWAQIKRAGLKDALLYTNPGTRKLSFSLVLSDKVVNRPGAWQNGAFIQTALSVYQQLQAYAKAATRMRMAYSSTENGTWRITALSMSSINRDEFTSEINWMTVELELTEATDITLGLGPVTGGVAPPPASAPAPPAGSSTQTSSRYYDTKSGDTLWAIAVKYYNDGSKWPTIADANGIKDPRTLGVGVHLRIP
jgi:nucleoid-associated protein YgaU